MGNFLWSVIWLLGLIVVGWPVAGLVAAFYIFCLPFVVCIEPCKAFVEFLEKGIKLPVYFAEQMKEGKPCCG